MKGKILSTAVAVFRDERVKVQEKRLKKVTAKEDKFSPVFYLLGLGCDTTD